MPKEGSKKAPRNKAPNNRRRLERLLRQMLTAELAFPDCIALASASHRTSAPYRRIIE